jgi:hypothetical protein
MLGYNTIKNKIMMIGCHCGCLFLLVKIDPVSLKKHQFGLGFIDIQVPLFLPRHPGSVFPAVKL